MPLVTDTVWKVVEGARVQLMVCRVSVGSPDGGGATVVGTCTAGGAVVANTKSKSTPRPAIASAPIAISGAMADPIPTPTSTPASAVRNSAVAAAKPVVAREAASSASHNRKSEVPSKVPTVRRPDPTPGQVSGTVVQCPDGSERVLGLPVA